MKYQHLAALTDLLSQRLITKREHPKLPLYIYNYTIQAQFLPIAEWSEPLKDCRGLILDYSGEIVARPFRKFWNWEQVLDQIPSGESFTVWEKLDGSLCIVCLWVDDIYGEQLVVATRGSFESEQAIWARQHLKDISLYKPGLTYLHEVIYPENRIVVDYGDRRDMPLLAVLDHFGNDHQEFDRWPASKAKHYAGLSDLSSLAALALPGEEGFVVRWQSGMRAKIKFSEYVRLHRLITSCSTRTIWELLRSGKGVGELLERVPAEFSQWVSDQSREMSFAHNGMIGHAVSQFGSVVKLCGGSSRKEFAEYAKKQDHPGLMFALLDGKDISDMCWKLVEPKWATPFRKEPE